MAVILDDSISGPNDDRVHEACACIFSTAVLSKRCGLPPTPIACFVRLGRRCTRRVKVVEPEKTIRSIDEGAIFNQVERVRLVSIRKEKGHGRSL